MPSREVLADAELDHRHALIADDETTHGDIHRAACRELQEPHVPLRDAELGTQASTDEALRALVVEDRATDELGHDRARERGALRRGELERRVLPAEPDAARREVGIGLGGQVAAEADADVDHHRAILCMRSTTGGEQGDERDQVGGSHAPIIADPSRPGV